MRRDAYRRSREMLQFKLRYLRFVGRDHHSAERAVGEQRVQRRLAAILAADVAGYSRLTGVDEEGTIARLRALRRELIDPPTALAEADELIE